MEWVAYYTDNTQLKQFEDGKEHLFKEIDQEKLEGFALFESIQIASVNLKTGEIKVNSTILEFPEPHFKDAKFRLIYFRRVRQVIGSSKDSSVKHYIGWQTTVQNRNHKRLISFKNNKIAIECD